MSSWKIRYTELLDISAKNGTAELTPHHLGYDLAVANSHILQAYPKDTLGNSLNPTWSLQAAAPILGVYQVVQGIRLIKIKLNTNVKRDPNNVRLYVFQGTLFATYDGISYNQMVPMNPLSRKSAFSEDEYESLQVPLSESKALAIIKNPIAYLDYQPNCQYKRYTENEGSYAISVIVMVLCSLLCFVSIIHFPSSEADKVEKENTTNNNNKINGEETIVKIPSKAKLKENEEKKEKIQQTVIQPSSGLISNLKVGQLTIFTNKILGYGSLGTIVYRGKFDNRVVAVKRLLKPFNDVATKEITALIASDSHPNVIRYYTNEEDK